MPNFLKNAIDESSLGLKSLPKIAPHTFPRWHPKNPILNYGHSVLKFLKIVSLVIWN